MDSKESLGYLKGLIEGLGLDDEAKETKVFNAIVDVLENLVYDNEEIQENMDFLAQGLDDVYEELDHDCDCGCDCCDDDEFEIQCPKCGADLVATWDDIEEGGIQCDKCGEFIELEVEEDDSEE